MPLRQRRPSGVLGAAVRAVQEAGMTLVDIALLNAALAERDAAREENARLRAAVERVVDALRTSAADSLVESPNRKPVVGAIAVVEQLCKALAVPTADDGAERGAR